MCDLIFYAITCYVSSWDTGKINASDKIIFETKKEKNMELKDILHKSPFKRSFRYRIHSLLRLADAR